MSDVRCLVLDHDDTVVRSEETVNFPAFQAALKRLRPERTVTLEEFSRQCFRLGFFGMCCEIYGFTPEEQEVQLAFWTQYVRTHVPPPYEGLLPLLTRFRAAGGWICVSSHSGRENITRDYQTHFGFLPDRIYGWDIGQDRMKPAPYALDDIMAAYSLRPEELLVVDDLTTGLKMAESRGVPFACAGWSHHTPEIAAYMKQHCRRYLNSPQELEPLLFETAKIG